jgi:FAD synthetase
MKRVLVFGTFDLLHPGHLKFLGEARKHGDELIVVVARDARVQAHKPKPIFKEQERVRLVRSLQLVDRALLGDPKGRWGTITKIKPDVICLGYDQSLDHPGIQKQLQSLQKKPKIVQLKAHLPKRFTSTRLRKQLGV